MTVTQVPQPGNTGEYNCTAVITGNSAAGVKAYMSFSDQTDLQPNAGNVADSFQGVVFPFQDTNGNPLTPTFNTQTSHGSVSIMVSVYIPGQAVAQPTQSIVIVDW